MLMVLWCFCCFWATTAQNQGCFKFFYFPTGEGGGWGGNRTRTDDQNWPKGYSMSSDTMWKNFKFLKSWPRRQLLLMGWLSITWWLVKNCIIYQFLSNILLYLLHIYISFFPILFHTPVEEVYECSIELLLAKLNHSI